MIKHAQYYLYMSSSSYVLHGPSVRAPLSVLALLLRLFVLRNLAALGLLLRGQRGAARRDHLHQ